MMNEMPTSAFGCDHLTLCPNLSASAKYPEIEFAKVDVDELNDTTAKAGVRVSADTNCTLFPRGFSFRHLTC